MARREANRSGRRLHRTSSPLVAIRDEDVGEVPHRRGEIGVPFEIPRQKYQHVGPVGLHERPVNRVEGRTLLQEGAGVDVQVFGVGRIGDRRQH